MSNRRIIEIYRGYRRLKDRRHKMHPAQYVKELELLRLDLEAQIGEVQISQPELAILVKALSRS